MGWHWAKSTYGSKVAVAVPDTNSSDLMLLSAATKSSLAEVLGLVQKTVLNAVYILLRLFISLIPLSRRQNLKMKHRLRWHACALKRMKPEMNATRHLRHSMPPKYRPQNTKMRCIHFATRFLAAEMTFFSVIANARDG
jgi:hypothetical protein